MHPRTLAICAILIGVLSVAVTGQPKPPPGARPLAETAAAQPPLPSRADIEARLQQLAANTDLDAAVRTQATEQFNEALAQLTRAADAAKRAADLRTQTASIPAQLETIRQELSSPSAEPAPDVPADATLQQLEQRQQAVAAELAAAREQAATLQTEAQRRQSRRGEISDALGRLRQQLAEVQTSLADVPAANGEVPALIDASRAILGARRGALVAEIDSLEAELANLDARRDLLPARIDLVLRRVATLETLSRQWQEIVSRKRQEQGEADRRAAERLAREQTVQSAPALAAFAETTTALARERTGEEGLPARIADAGAELASDKTELTNLRSSYASLDRRVRASGMTRATGLLLRRQFAQLPDAGEIRRRLAETRNALEQAEYNLIDFQERRVEAGDIDSVVESLLRELPAEQRTDQARAVVRDLAVARRDLLDSLVADAATYFDQLIELEQATASLLAATEAYEAYVSERVLWVRSVPQTADVSIGALAGSVLWFLDPVAWRDAFGSTLSAAIDNVILTLLSMLALAVLYLTHRKARLRISELGKLVTRYRTDSMRHTIEALVLTLLLGVLAPATLWWFGWLLHLPLDQHIVAIAVGTGLKDAALFLLPLMMLWHVLRPKGLGDAHFRWPPGASGSIRIHLRWFLPIVTPAAALIGAIDAMPTDEGLQETANATLGRLAFSIALVALAIFTQRVLRPGGAVLGEFMRRNRGGWVDRLRVLWYPALVLLPLTLVIVSWLGFDYTARQIETKFEYTLGLVLLVVVINAVLMRWLFIARRRVAIEDAKRRREQQVVESDKKPDTAAQAEAIAPVDEDKLDLPSISGQTRQLFRTLIAVGVVLGMYGIWADVLPALRMLDRVEIWPEQRLVAEEEAAPPAILLPQQPAQPIAAQPAAPAAAQPSASAPQPTMVPIPGVSTGGTEATPAAAAVRVTLADLGLALVILIATSVAFRNLPGLVEIAVLQRLPLDAGSRYALATVLKYIIAILGTLAAFGTLGIAWDNVQWLAAALTFGLAFGLQEIFANFVSGLIILAERPIRVGDTVTVNGISGTVSRIRMRATTITDWDRKDLVIPNKSFVTGEVVNWTLSDTRTRLIVPVGVAYGSDVEKVEQILLRVVRESPDVLPDPKPYVLFSSFGDSTLNFEVRAILTHVDRILAARHDLHMRITREFRAAGIEIAFPQRDLHIRDLDKLTEFVRLAKDSGSIPAGAKTD